MRWRNASCRSEEHTSELQSPVHLVLPSFPTRRSSDLIGGKGYELADNIAAIVAALIIAWNGGRLLRPAFNDLMDRSPGRAVQQQIRRVAEQTPGVDAVEKCLVQIGRAHV